MKNYFQENILYCLFDCNDNCPPKTPTIYDVIIFFSQNFSFDWIIRLMFEY